MPVQREQQQSTLFVWQLGVQDRNKLLTSLDIYRTKKSWAALQLHIEADKNTKRLVVSDQALAIAGSSYLVSAGWQIPTFVQLTDEGPEGD